jgi:hypothetical protein
MSLRSKWLSLRSNPLPDERVFCRTSGRPPCICISPRRQSALSVSGCGCKCRHDWACSKHTKSILHSVIIRKSSKCASLRRYFSFVLKIHLRTKHQRSNIIGEQSIWKIMKWYSYNGNISTVDVLECYFFTKLNVFIISKFSSAPFFIIVGIKGLPHQMWTNKPQRWAVLTITFSIYWEHREREMGEAKILYLPND